MEKPEDAWETQIYELVNRASPFWLEHLPVHLKFASGLPLHRHITKDHGIRDEKESHAFCNKW